MKGSVIKKIVGPWHIIKEEYKCWQDKITSNSNVKTFILSILIENWKIWFLIKKNKYIQYFWTHDYSNILVHDFNEPRKQIHSMMIVSEFHAFQISMLNFLLPWFLLFGLFFQCMNTTTFRKWIYHKSKYVYKF